MIISAYLFILAASTSTRLQGGSSSSIPPPHLSMLPSLTDTAPSGAARGLRGLPASGSSWEHLRWQGGKPLHSHHLDGHFCMGGAGNHCISQTWTLLPSLEWARLCFYACVVFYFIFVSGLLTGGVASGLGWAHAGILGNSTVGGMVKSDHARKVSSG